MHLWVCINTSHHPPHSNQLLQDAKQDVGVQTAFMCLIQHNDLCGATEDGKEMSRATHTHALSNSTDTHADGEGSVSSHSLIAQHSHILHAKAHSFESTSLTEYLLSCLSSRHSRSSVPSVEQGERGKSVFVHEMMRSYGDMRKQTASARTCAERGSLSPVRYLMRVSGLLQSSKRTA